MLRIEKQSPDRFTINCVIDGKEFYSGENIPLKTLERFLKNTEIHAADQMYALWILMYSHKPVEFTDDNQLTNKVLVQ